MSVIEYVDKVILWDTGSTDGTLDVIEQIRKSPKAYGKIAFESHPEPFDEEKMRQQMLDKTSGDWFIVVDGDEIWWEDSIKKVVELIKVSGDELESIVVPTINMVGDIYHYQEEKAGNYHLAGKTGHYAIRAINRRIPGLHSYGPHGIWGWVDDIKRQIQDRDPNKIAFVDAPYIHTTFLSRASKRAQDSLVLKRSFKRKHEIGIEVARDYYYPEVFFRPRPAIVPSVWETMTPGFRRRAQLLTPLRKVKRRTLNKRTGY